MAGESAWSTSRTVDVVAKFGSRLMRASPPSRRRGRPLPSWRDRYGRGSECPHVLAGGVARCFSSQRAISSYGTPCQFPQTYREVTVFEGALFVFFLASWYSGEGRKLIPPILPRLSNLETKA